VARTPSRFPKHGPELRALLAACHREPNDDTPRLVLADWLQEHDDPRGELIRLQVRLAAMPADDPEYDALFELHQKWWGAHQHLWVRETGELMYEPGPHDRGLPTLGHFEEVGCELSVEELEKPQKAGTRALIADGWPEIAWVIVNNPISEDMAVLERRALDREPWIGSSTPVGIALGAFFPLTAKVLDLYAQIPNLRGLSFDGNALSAAQLSRLAKIEHLEHLDLNEFRLNDRHLALLAPLKRLRTLIAYSATLTNTGAEQLAGLTELRRLDIDGRFGAAGHRALGTLSKLEDLRLLKADDSAIQNLSGLSRLRRLRLHYTHVTGRGLDNFPLLTHLYLDAARVGDDGLACVAKLKRLRHLDLLNTRVTGKLFPHLSGLRWLEEFTASSEDISDKALVHLEPLKNLTSLHLSGTRVTKRGANRLQKVLKKATIFHGGS
jgi:uncharacterized protein (TIGR02996 family)